MKKLAVLLCLAATPAAAQNCTTSFVGNTAYTNCYGSGNSFQDGYNAARGDDSEWAALANRRNTEAIINESRARRGLPPCSLAPLGFLVGRTAC